MKNSKVTRKHKTLRVLAQILRHGILILMAYYLISMALMSFIPSLNLEILRQSPFEPNDAYSIGSAVYVFLPCLFVDSLILALQIFIVYLLYRGSSRLLTYFKDIYKKRFPKEFEEIKEL